jgi:riboflavin synthase
MFTGIIEEQGTVVSAARTGHTIRLCVECSKVGTDLTEGQSIAVDGVCLTVTDREQRQGLYIFCTDVMPETFINTTIPLLYRGGKVNLERAMKVDDRFGGHIVTGHIDGTGIICSAVKKENEVSYTIAVSASVLNGIVDKGSVAVDGISLTVTAVAYVQKDRGTFSVSVIPHTREMSGIPSKRYGSTVNIECDVIGKYVARYLRRNLNSREETGGTEWIEQDLLQ